MTVEKVRVEEWWSCRLPDTSSLHRRKWLKMITWARRIVMMMMMMMITSAAPVTSFILSATS